MFLPIIPNVFEPLLESYDCHIKVNRHNSFLTFWTSRWLGSYQRRVQGKSSDLDVTRDYCLGPTTVPGRKSCMEQEKTEDRVYIVSRVSNQSKKVVVFQKRETVGPYDDPMDSR